MRKFSRLTVLIIASLLPGYAAQATDQPKPYAKTPAEAQAEAQAVMQRATQQLLDRLKVRPQAYAEDEQLLYGMLQEVVLPVINMRLISRLALGPHWKLVDGSQKERFIRGFQASLMKNYGKAMLLLPDIRIEYAPQLPSKQDQPRKKYQIVRTQVITSSNKPPLSINYSLIDREGWKVFDIVIEGTSMVRQFRSGFDQEIREAGFEALLERLEQFNTAASNS